MKTQYSNVRCLEISMLKFPWNECQTVIWMQYEQVQNTIKFTICVRMKAGNVRWIQFYSLINIIVRIFYPNETSLENFHFCKSKKKIILKSWIKLWEIICTKSSNAKCWDPHIHRGINGLMHIFIKTYKLGAMTMLIIPNGIWRKKTRSKNSVSRLTEPHSHLTLKSKICCSFIAWWLCGQH